MVKMTRARFYDLTLWSAYTLFLQSIFLLVLQSDSALKLNLLIQVFSVAVLALFSKTASSTYLNAPLVFASSILVWHSAFLLGYYFELSPIFSFAGDTLNIGFQYVYKATALVGLSLALTIVGEMWGFRSQRALTRTAPPNSPISRTANSSLGPTSTKVGWLLFSVMALFLILFMVVEGPGVFGGRYLDFYAEEKSSLIARLFFRSEFFWVFVIVLLVACYRRHRWSRCAVALLAFIVAVLLAMLGPRTGPFICLTALLLSWDCFVQRIKLRWIATFVLFLSAASFIIASGRETGLGAHVFQFGDTGRDKVEFLDLFYEQGKSIAVVLRTMEFSKEGGLVYGRTILDSALSVIPLPVLKLVGYEFAPSLGNWIVDNSPDLAPNEGAGSSLVAEFYYNFGMMGCAFFVIIGWTISKYYFKYIYHGDIYIGVGITTVAAMYTVMMRNDIDSSFRLLVYTFIIIKILKNSEQNLRGRSRDTSRGLDSASVPGRTPSDLLGPAPLA